MKPLFHTQLVNGTRGDPALYIDFQFHRRALMFDLGDVSRLEPRHVLRRAGMRGWGLNPVGGNPRSHG